jgi:hypothetical protein
MMYKKERETMDSTRLTKEANEKRRLEWLYQTKERRISDMSATKVAARKRRRARAERLSDLQEAAQSKSGN